MSPQPLTPKLSTQSNPPITFNAATPKPDIKNPAAKLTKITYKAVALTAFTTPATRNNSNSSVQNGKTSHQLSEKLNSKETSTSSAHHSGLLAGIVVLAVVTVILLVVVSYWLIHKFRYVQDNAVCLL